MTSFHLKNKTIAAFLALIFGQLGLHRLYLFGLKDHWIWVHPVMASLGWWGVYRARHFGQDDQLAWVLIPLLGFTLAANAFIVLYYGLMSSEKWNAKHNPDHLESTAGNTHWLTIGAVVVALLFGAVTLMSSLAFSFQRYFEYQVEEARKISQ